MTYKEARKRARLEYELDHRRAMLSIRMGIFIVIVATIISITLQNIL